MIISSPVLISHRGNRVPSQEQNAPDWLILALPTNDASAGSRGSLFVSSQPSRYAKKVPFILISFRYSITNPDLDYDSDTACVIKAPSPRRSPRMSPKRSQKKINPKIQFKQRSIPAYTSSPVLRNPSEAAISSPLPEVNKKSSIEVMDFLNVYVTPENSPRNRFTVDEVDVEPPSPLVPFHIHNTH